ncbi:integration host factor subunit alpha [Methylosinus sp. Ce-a6]|uniref:integration host factor subunit alpha n=1 Tax=Methylosinus sp. Ce-a6 TaxID=2172005 RepID=UPI002739D0D4|nr:integration host factor subunit alpha [Methylosinus sp. Ce-a6]
MCFRGNGGKPDGILDAAVSRSTVTRDDLAHAIYARIPGLSRADAKALLDCALEEMLSALTSGEDVKLRGFGTFRIRSKNARPGRNPKTGAAALISSRRVVVFKAAPHLKSAVAASGASPAADDSP